ncbi:hypothetical protein [Methylobacterium organophilum]|uniref:Uncharacterized protein n=1 Tax=Methylobacterium organophilum TaxID=410 RepID=A0ABQ4T7I6_METOR|nr:hypothetical protein [Methylobacterium organophilum]UMY16983.1 hypothetical protein MMB17_20395 [Methylobacterium organophilum]GJE26996.1 hypothetical protein LKMONMHP_1852 [Methylobacterium organophilum]
MRAADAFGQFGPFLGPILGFMAPLPPRWERAERHEPQAPNFWLIGLIAWFLLVVTLVPLSLALAEGQALAAFGAQCRASGGRVTHVPEDGRPYRCDR